MKYEIKRSNRRTIGLEMTPGELLVRAPYKAGVKDIERVIRENQSWICRTESKMRSTMQAVSEEGTLTPEDIEELKFRAKSIIPERVAHYADIIGVRPNRITVKCQRSKWGSCSARGNLNFNCLLLLAPPEVLDCIVVHELCHLKEMNHSERFYREMLSAYPDYRKWHSWLKRNGDILMKRMEAGRKGGISDGAG